MPRQIAMVDEFKTVTAKLQVKEIAESKNFTLSSLQRRTGLTFQLLSHLWHGDGQHISLRALGVVAKALNVSPGELLMLGEWDEDSKTEKQTNSKRKSGGRQRMRSTT